HGRHQRRGVPGGRRVGAREPRPAGRRDLPRRGVPLPGHRLRRRLAGGEGGAPRRPPAGAGGVGPPPRRRRPVGVLPLGPPLVRRGDGPAPRGPEAGAGVSAAPAGKALLFVESNTSGTGRLFARTARNLGFVPVLITARPGKYAYLAEEGAPEVVVVPRVDEDELHA